MPPAQPVSWQPASTSGQLGGYVQLHSQRVERGFTGSNATCDMFTHLPDSGNSRDSWSSTSSNVVARQQVPVDQQCLVYHDPAQQQSQYGRHVHHQQHHVYDWAHRHTCGQVETNQSRCRQTYPQQVQQPYCPTFRYVNERTQNQHQYLRPTSTAYPYHRMTQQTATHRPSACYSATSPFDLPVQRPGAELSNPGSTRIDMEQQRVAASFRPPRSTQSQLITTSQTPLHCYQCCDSTHTTIPVKREIQPRPQQHDARLLTNNSPNMLSSDLGLRWYREPSYDNSVMQDCIETSSDINYELRLL